VVALIVDDSMRESKDVAKMTGVIFYPFFFFSPSSAHPLFFGFSCSLLSLCSLYAHLFIELMVVMLVLVVEAVVVVVLIVVAMCVW
jgi:hypothetical protein